MPICSINIYISTPLLTLYNQLLILSLSHSLAAPDTVTLDEEQANHQRNKAGSLPSRLYVFNFFDTMFIPSVSVPISQESIAAAVMAVPTELISPSLRSDNNNINNNINNNNVIDYSNNANSTRNSLLNRMAAISNNIHNRRPNNNSSIEGGLSSRSSGDSVLGEQLLLHSSTAASSTLHSSSSSSSLLSRITSNIHNNQNSNRSVSIHNINNNNHQNSNICDNDTILSIHKPIFIDPRTKMIMTNNSSSDSASNDSNVTVVVPYDIKQYTDQVMLCLFKIILSDNDSDDNPISDDHSSVIKNGDDLSTVESMNKQHKRQQGGGVIMELIQHRNISGESLL